MALHNSLASAELHELKGAAAAAKGELPIASGAGTSPFAALLTNTKYINILADFPAASGGKITLTANTNYCIGADINIGTDYLEFSNGSTLMSASIFTATITYTGTAAMIQSVDADVRIGAITLDCPNSDVYDVAETTGGAKVFFANDIIYLRCKEIGTFDKVKTVALGSSEARDCTSGVTIAGTASVSVVINSIVMTSTSTTFIGLDLTGATINALTIATVSFSGGVGSIGIKGDAASANITSGFIADIVNCQFSGVTTPLSGITTDDIRYEFLGNGSVPDTFPDALVAMVSNATVTTLSVGVPTLIAGTLIVERESHFTATAAGRATYNGERDLTTPIDISVVIDPVSGTNKTIRAYVALNGSAIINSGIAVNISAGDPKQISVPWQLTLTNGDFVETFIENETDSVDCTAIDATLRLR